MDHTEVVCVHVRIIIIMAMAWLSLPYLPEYRSTLKKLNRLVQLTTYTPNNHDIINSALE